MTSDRVRESVWDEMMDAERLSRYYGRLAKRYVRRSRAVLIVPALFATSAVAALLHTLPEQVLTVANVVIVGISMVAIVTQPSIKAAGIIVVSNACDDLLVDWKRLWSDTERIDDEAAKWRLHELGLKMNAATNKAKELPVLDKKLNRRCLAEVDRVFG